jgi:phosphoserine phosphatase RsbU/P
VRALLHKIARTGVRPDTPFHLRNKITVLNNANLLITFISIFYTVVGAYYEYYLAIVFTFFSIFSTTLAFFMLHRGRYRFVFHYIMWYGCIFLASFSYLFGGLNNSHYYFLFMPVACNILFDELKPTLIYLFVAILLMLASVAYIDYCEPYYPMDADLKPFGYPNVVFVSLLIFLGVRLFKQDNVRYADTINEQRQSLEEKNREITDSINYAKKIQSALIPSAEAFNAHFRDSFIVFKPKDIVSGDFYWITKKGAKIFYATADCTGHGVPGGFMTMLGISFLDEIVNERNVDEPAEILNQLRDRIVSTLKQSGSAGENKDGMDIALCCLDTETRMLRYAAANNSVYVLGASDRRLRELKPDKQPVGFHHQPAPFTSNMLQLEEGDCVYTFSDGYADQFGGEKGKKFKYKNLEELLLRSHTDFALQESLLNDTFEKWKGELEQVDDVLLIGIRV